MPTIESPIGLGVRLTLKQETTKLASLNFLQEQARFDDLINRSMSRAFARLLVGIREVADEIWLACLAGASACMEYDVGFFDQDEGPYNRPRIRSYQKCYLCLRYEAPPMCAGRTPGEMAVDGVTSERSCVNSHIFENHLSIFLELNGTFSYQ